MAPVSRTCSVAASQRALATSAIPSRTGSHRDRRRSPTLAYISAALAVAVVWSSFSRKELRAESRPDGSGGAADEQGTKVPRSITGGELAQHASKGDCWVCIDGIVYDVTEFLAAHPGGADLILEHGGKDITSLFSRLHPRGTLQASLTATDVVGQADKSFPPMLAQTDEDEDDIEDRRASLPPLSSVQNLATFERLARNVLGEDSRAWKYISSVSDDGWTFNETKTAFTQIRFLPRVNVPVADVDPSTVMLSTTRCPIPIYMAPTGQNRVAHPDGEYNTLRASAATGVPMILSNASSVSLEEALDERQRLSRTQPPAPFWWQLYIRKDRTKNEEQIKQAAAGGVDAIVITVDVTALGNREGDAAHPERAKEQDHGKEYEIRGLTPLLSGQLDANLSWGDIAWVRKLAPGVPILVKGIAAIEDIELAYEHGAAGVILSTHGGRQLDFAPPPLATLARVRRDRPDLFTKLEIYIDGGIQRGTDILKAMCLGAKGVGIGRVPMYAQAAYGEAGIHRALQILSDEIYTGMRLLGVRAVSELRPELLEIMPGLLGQQARSEGWTRE